MNNCILITHNGAIGMRKQSFGIIEKQIGTCNRRKAVRLGMAKSGLFIISYNNNFFFIYFAI